MIAWKISWRTSSSVINLSLYGLPLQALEWTEGALERRWGPSGPPTSLITSRAGDQLLHSGLALPVSPAHKLGRKRQQRVVKVECVRGKRVQSDDCVRGSRHQRVE